MSSEVEAICMDNLVPQVPNAPMEKSELVANDILNDILETAMDIATGKQPACEEVHQDVEHIIEGLNKVHDEVQHPTLDIEMKRILSDIMSVPDAHSQDMGIGDSPPMNTRPPQPPVQSARGVEKKSRITDLVMNSKKALDNLLSEEQRKKQDDWEETNEQLIQVIDLGQAPTADSSSASVPPEVFPLPVDDDDDELLMPRTNEAAMDAIELSAGKCGEGDEKSVAGAQKPAKKSLFTSAKKKRWSFGLYKLFNFLKNRGGKNKEEAQNE